MYLKIATIAKEYEVSVSTVGHLLPEVRKLVGERYPKDAVISTGVPPEGAARVGGRLEWKIWILKAKERHREK